MHRRSVSVSTFTATESARGHEVRQDEASGTRRAVRVLAEEELLQLAPLDPYAACAAAGGRYNRARGTCEVVVADARAMCPAEAGLRYSYARDVCVPIDEENA